MKQTTTEWIIEQLDLNDDPMSMLKIIDQARQMEKEQAERMYSEEDMKVAFETGRNFQLTGEDNFNELIEQLKKK
jgi:hypothetical protein